MKKKTRQLRPVDNEALPVKKQEICMAPAKEAEAEIPLILLLELLAMQEAEAWTEDDREAEEMAESGQAKGLRMDEDEAIRGIETRRAHGIDHAGWRP